MHTQKMKESDDDRKRIVQEFQNDRIKQHSRDVASSKHTEFNRVTDGAEESKGHHLEST